LDYQYVTVAGENDIQLWYVGDLCFFVSFPKMLTVWRVAGAPIQLTPDDTRQGNYDLHFTLQPLDGGVAVTLPSEASLHVTIALLEVQRVPLAPLVELEHTPPPATPTQPPHAFHYYQLPPTLPSGARLVAHVEHRFNAPPSLRGGGDAATSAAVVDYTCALAASVARGTLRTCAAQLYDAIALGPWQPEMQNSDVRAVWSVAPSALCDDMARRGVVARFVAPVWRHSPAAIVDLCLGVDADPLRCAEAAGAPLLETSACATPTLDANAEQLWRQCGALASAALHRTPPAPATNTTGTPWAVACAYGALRRLFYRCSAPTTTSTTDTNNNDDDDVKSRTAPLVGACQLNASDAFSRAFATNSDAMLACRRALADTLALTTHLNAVAFDAVCNRLPDAPQTSGDVASPRRHCRETTRLYVAAQRSPTTTPPACTAPLSLMGTAGAASLHTDASLFVANAHYWQPATLSARHDVADGNSGKPMWLATTTSVDHLSIRLAMTLDAPQPSVTATSLAHSTTKPSTTARKTAATTTNEADNTDDEPGDDAPASTSQSTATPAYNARGCASHCLRYCGATASRLCRCGGAVVACDGAQHAAHDETAQSDDGPAISTTAAGAASADWVTMLAVGGGLGLCAVAVGGVTLGHWRRKRHRRRLHV
jgi:hypothetical protein